MTLLHARGWVSVVELIFFIPTAIAAVVACSRHGFHRSSGWIYTLILCLVRIIGAICQLLTYHDHSSGLIKATIIIDSIGLSPLLLATLGMLSRLVDFINSRSSSPLFTVKQFRLIQLMITLGLILSVAGGSSANTQPDGKVQIATTSKVGIVLYIIGYVALSLVYMLSLSRTSSVPAKERRIPIAVTFALPFILVRLAYSACAVFIHDHLFNVVDGSVVVLVVMAVLEEFIVVIIYIILGFSVDKLDETVQGPIAARVWKDKKGKNNRRHRSQSRDVYDLEAARVQPMQNTAYAGPQQPLQAYPQGYQHVGTVGNA